MQHAAFPLPLFLFRHLSAYSLLILLRQGYGALNSSSSTKERANAHLHETGSFWVAYTAEEFRVRYS
jgi:hypothetical protein